MLQHTTSPFADPFYSEANFVLLLFEGYFLGLFSIYILLLIVFL